MNSSFQRPLGPVLAISLLTAVLLMACKTTDTVVRSSVKHDLGANQGTAITYDSRGRGAYILIKGDKLRVCAEQFPDASANVSAAVAAKVAAEAQSTVKDLINAKLGMASDSSETAKSDIVNVAERTESVMVLREALYRLCELHLNDVLTQEQARASFQYVLSTVRLLGNRDQVGTLAAVLTNDNLSSDDRGQVLRTIHALSISALADRIDSQELKTAISAAVTADTLTPSQDVVTARAEKLERGAYDELIQGNVDKAIGEFEKVRKLYPYHRNVEQIITLLNANDDQLKAQAVPRAAGAAPDAGAKRIYDEIIKLSQGVPVDIIERLREKAR